MKRNLLDMLLLIMFLLLMAFSYIPHLWHEVIGIIILGAVALHLDWNFQWFKGLLKGRWSLLRGAATLINAMLLVNVVVILVTGIFMSNFLFKEYISIELQRSMLVHQLHVSLSWLLIILIGLHLGLHGQGLWQRFRKWRNINVSAVWYKAAVWIVPVLVIVLGCYASFANQVGNHLLLKHIFGTAASRQPGPIFALLLLGLVGMYMFIGVWTQKLLLKLSRKK